MPLGHRKKTYPLVKEQTLKKKNITKIHPSEELLDFHCHPKLTLETIIVVKF